MTTDPEKLDEQKLNEILKKLDQPQDEVFGETALQRALINIQKIGQDGAEPDLTTVKNRDDVAHLTTGTRLGDFAIDRKITQGGMGVIYSATQEPIGRMVALKTIIPGRANTLTLERFRREREILGQLHESNIVSIFAAGTQDEIEYFAMPYIEGLSIRRLVKRIRSSQGQMSLRDIVSHHLAPSPEPKLDEKPDNTDQSNGASGDWRPTKSYLDEVVQLIIDLADGVQAVHNAGYIHRDITPNNVLVDIGGRPWLIDFGIATSIPEDATSVPSPGIYTQSIDGQLGTPRYKAPELRENMAGRPTDVFGLGVCFYCLLTAQDFSNDDYFDQEASNEQLKSSTIPRALAAVCKKALNAEPRKRYQSPHELAEDLQRWLRNELVSSRAYPLRERIGLWVKRNPVKALGAAAIFLIVSISSFAMIQRANANALEHQSHLEKLSNMFLRGEIEDALRFVSDDDQTLQLGAKTDPELFLNLVKRLVWLGETDEAQRQIESARLSNPGGPMLARLALVDAEAKSGFDFDQAQTLALQARDTKHLNEIETHLANALCSQDSLAEQEHLIAVVSSDKFQLRAHQLLVLNHLYLGQKSEAALQLAKAKMLFPSDLNLNIAQALLAAFEGKREQATKELQHLKINRNTQVAELLDKLAESLPEPDKLQSTDTNVFFTEVDQTLVRISLLQPEFFEEGLILLPPVLYRALETLRGWNKGLTGPDDPNWWPTVERRLTPFCRVHPEGVFVFALARALIAQQIPETAENERWFRSADWLERALNTGSIVDIQPLLVQQLALTRVEIYRYRSAQSDSAKQKMLEALQLFDNRGKTPSESRLCQNLVEAALVFSDLTMAASFAERWRRSFPNDASAFAYSAHVADFQKRWPSALEWSFKALQLDPDHEFKNRLTRIQETCANEIKKYEVFENISDR